MQSWSEFGLGRVIELEGRLMYRYIDSHCHLDFDVFDEDRPQVIADCLEAGVECVVVPGTRPSCWQKQLQLADEFPLLKSSLGIHPYFLSGLDESSLDQLESTVVQHRNAIVAIGETGLDFVIDIGLDKQTVFFRRQLILAAKLSLPVIVHSRKAHSLVSKYLRETRIGRGVIHGFSGSYEEAKAFCNQGFAIGVGGGITYDRAQKTRRSIARLPLGSLVLETDAPDMPLSGRQGQRNSPVYVAEVFRSLVLLRPEPEEVIAEQLRLNARALFNIDT